MRHRVAHRKLGRVTEHRLATLRSLSQMLLRHERIDTTLAKAKELRPFVERLITVAKRGLEVGVDTPRALHARRLVARDLADKKVASKLFESIAPRFASRPGGYTRVLRLGRRKGDCAEIAQIEFVGSEYDPNLEESTEGTEQAAASSSEGVSGRLRAAAKRLRGGRKSQAEKDADTETDDE
jgi:large subunit ribosomal protein L17